MYRDEHLRAIDNALLRVKDKIEQKIKEEAARVKLLSIRGLWVAMNEQKVYK